MSGRPRLSMQDRSEYKIKSWTIKLVLSSNCRCGQDAKNTS